MALAAVVCLGSAVVAPVLAKQSEGDVASDVTAIREALLMARHEIAPPQSAGPSVYLSYRGDFAIRRAELRILGEGDQVRHRIAFVPDTDDELQRLERRDATGVQASEARDCRLAVTLSDGDKQVLDCRMPPVTGDAMLEFLVVEGWVGTLSVRALDWRPALAESQWDPEAWREVGLMERLVAPFRPETSAARDQSAARQVRDSGTSAAPHARFDLARCQSNPSQAMFHLYRYRSAEQAELGAGFWRDYARCALDAELAVQARYAARRLHSVVPGSDAEMETRWRIARYLAARGDGAEALIWLEPALSRVPSELDSRWRDLKSRLLLARGESAEALSLLSEGRHLNAAGEWLETYDATALHYAMRMNYAYALLQAGRDDQALAVLNRVGSSPGRDAASVAMRERANAKLGWHFLEQEYGATAARIFHRMSLQGPYASVALLGMGWAMLTPPGEAEELVAPPGFEAAESDPPPTALKSLQRTGAIGCEQYRDAARDEVTECIPKQKFERLSFAETRDERMRRALVYWDRLIASDRRDTAALEAHLAAARAYAELGDVRRGQELYERAAELAQRAGSSIDALEKRLREPTQLLGRTGDGQDTRLTPSAQSVGPLERGLVPWLSRTENRLLMRTIDAADGIAADIEDLAARSDDQSAQADWLASLRERLESVTGQARERLQASADPVLKRVRERYERYRYQAELELAGLRERAEAEVATTAR